MSNFEDEEDYELVDDNAAMDDSIVDIARGPGFAHVNMDGKGSNSLISDQQPPAPYTSRSNMVSGDDNPNASYAPLDPDSGWNNTNVTSYAKEERLWALRKIAKLTDEQKGEIKDLIDKILKVLQEPAKHEETEDIEPLELGSYQAGAYDNYQGTVNNGIGGSPPGGGGGGWGGIVDTMNYTQL